MSREDEQKREQKRKLEQRAAALRGNLRKRKEQERGRTRDEGRIS